jgi:uncharacterized protein YcfL
MKVTLYILLCIITFGLISCYQPQDQRVNVKEDIRSDTLENNIVTKPVIHAFSFLIGEGIEIRRAVTYVNKDGFMELEVSGYNRSFNPLRFEYKVEWLDRSGMVVDTTTSKWMLTSAAGKSDFAIKSVSPRKEAVDFRMNTRKTPE